VYAKLKKNDLILAKFLEYPSRDSVDLLRNVRLYVLRTDFPPTDDDNEFYLFDLIHLKVFSLTKESEPIGEVVNAFDYGAGTFLEVRLIDSGKVATFPFHKKAILSVNLQSSCITVDPEFLISL
jgi:16S rRNA processing protein RimM